MDRDRSLFDELSLKPEQRDAMNNKAMRFRGEIDKCRREIEGKRKELIAFLRVDNADQRAVDAVFKDINGNQERMQKMVVLHMLEIKASLGKNEQKKFFDLIEGTMNKSGSAACMPKDGAL
jgi:Spy/CpxP family protein refolding chaperone